MKRAKNFLHSIATWYRLRSGAIAIVLIVLSVLTMFVLQAATIFVLQGQVKRQLEATDSVNKHLDCMALFFQQEDWRQKSIHDIDDCRFEKATHKTPAKPSGSTGTSTTQPAATTSPAPSSLTTTPTKNNTKPVKKPTPPSKGDDGGSQPPQDQGLITNILQLILKEVI